MSRRARRTAVVTGLAWILVGATEIAGGATHTASVPAMLIADALILATTGTVAALVDRHDKATGARADDVLDAVTMNAAPVDVTYSLAFGQGKRIGFQEGWDARGVRANDGASGQVIQFPSATYAAQAAPTADETTVRLPTSLTALATARIRPAPHPRQRR